jgi:hypothetical protein
METVAMEKDAYEYLIEEIGQKLPQVIDVHDDGEEETKLILSGPGRESMLKAFKKEAPARRHKFASLAGFVGYLNSKHCEEGGVVFVGPTVAHADLRYQSSARHQVDLTLAKAEEFDALTRLGGGVGQKDLWRLLVSKLHGCLPEALLLAVASINVKGAIAANVEIEHTGLSQGGTSEQIVVNMGTSQAPVNVNWQWKGRIWECFDREFTVDLRLEIAMEDAAPKFTFHAQRLETVLREAREALVAELETTITAGRFLVFEGTY